MQSCIARGFSTAYNNGDTNSIQPIQEIPPSITVGVLHSKSSRLKNTHSLLSDTGSTERRKEEWEKFFDTFKM